MTKHHEAANMCACGRPTTGGNLCERCNKTLAIALCNVAAHYDDLGTVEAKQTRYTTNTGRVSSIGKSQPLPIDGRFADVTGTGTQTKWDAWSTVVTWCRIVMEEQPELSGPVCGEPCLHVSCAAIRRRRWPRNTIRSMCAYLDRQFQWIIREPWCDEFFDTMTETERQLCRLVNRPADRWYAGRCGYSDENGECTAELYAVAGRRNVTCPGCGIQHDVAERRAFLLKEAAEYLVTASEAAHALLVWTDYDGSEVKLVDRIRKWRDRELLEVREVTSLRGKDRHLYRLGDIQQLLIDAAQTKQHDQIVAS